MTLKNIFKNTGGGGDKAFDRYHHGSPQNPGYYPGGYNFHQPPPSFHNPHIFKHYSFSQTTANTGGSKGGSGAAMSALTLLSFLFFLNILQQCLKEHMMAMNPQIAVMSAGREEPNLQLEEATSKEGKVDMYLIKQPIHKLHGVGRAYPMDITEYGIFESSYAKNISNFKNDLET